MERCQPIDKGTNMTGAPLTFSLLVSFARRTPVLALAFLFITTSLTAQTRLEPKGTSEKGPVEISAYATEHTLFIQVDLKERWHAYAPGSKAGMPVALKSLETSDYLVSGELVVPQNEKGEVSGAAVFRAPIKKKKKAGEGNDLLVEFDYQVCDGRICLPPSTCKFSGKPSKGPARVLLMVREEGERTDRIIAMLNSEGFDCTTRTYESQPDKDFCDRFDVVIIDSENYGKSKALYKLANEFPKTQAPMVAVGYVGCRVISSHQIAMASGYM